MTTINYTSIVNNVPIVKQLNAIFRAIPDEAFTLFEIAQGTIIAMAEKLPAVVRK